MSSATGGRSTAIRWRGTGSNILGAEILTPGIAPATDALSGFELLDDSHEISATDATSAPTADRHLGFIDFHCVSERRTPFCRGWEPGARGWGERGLRGWGLGGSGGRGPGDLGLAAVPNPGPCTNR